MDAALEGRPSATGIKISNDTALNYSAVFNAVNIISGTIASLPLFLYKRTSERSKKRWKNHPLYNCLHNQPNEEMTSYVWREISQAHLLLQGNAYSEIGKNRIGQTEKLWPLNPMRMKVERNGRKLVYRYRLPDGTDRLYPPEKILHIPGLGFDGRVGYSILTVARESLGLGLAMETFQARFYGAGTNIGGVLEHPGKLGDLALQHLKESVKEKYGGLQKSHGLLVLEEDMKYKPLGMALDDAEFLGSRVFQISEIARWFNLPPHKLKELSKATFSNIEQQQIEFVQDSIRPWLVRWEQHLLWKLLNPDEREDYFAEFAIEGMLRGDMVARSTMLATMRQNGIIDANTWLGFENMNPLPGDPGKAIWMPLNMSDQNNPPEPAPAKEPFSPKEGEEEEKPKEEKKAANLETRALRSIKTRRNFRDAYKPLFRSITSQIVAKEKAGILKLAKKTLPQREAGDFIFELDKFYKSAKPEIRKLFAGVYENYSEAIYPFAAEEVNIDADIPDEFRVYVKEFVDHTTNRYVESSRGQMKQVVLKHRENDPTRAIEQRLDEWEERRPNKVADRETVDGECGIAQYVYYEAGFRTVWVTFDESCPYCESLNGMVVSRGMNFINAGQSLQPEGSVPLIPTANISHPAAHIGCDCSVRAGI